MSRIIPPPDEPDTILRAALRRSMYHGERRRDEEIRLLARAGHGIRPLARRFTMSPANVMRIVKAAWATSAASAG